MPLGSKEAYMNANCWKWFKTINEIEITNESIKGDLNGDGNIDLADINEIEKYLMGNPSPYFDVNDADINNDGIVNVADIVAITNQLYPKQ